VGLSVATGNFTASLPADALSTSIQELKAKQKQLREEKQQLAKELRNQERRKKRLRARARQMTDEDLVQVLMLRKRQKQDQEEKKRGPPPRVRHRLPRPRRRPRAAPLRPVLSPAPSTAEPLAGVPSQLHQQLSPSPATPLAGFFPTHDATVKHPVACFFLTELFASACTYTSAAHAKSVQRGTSELFFASSSVVMHMFRRCHVSVQVRARFSATKLCMTVCFLYVQLRTPWHDRRIAISVWAGAGLYC